MHFYHLFSPEHLNITIGGSVVKIAPIIISVLQLTLFTASSHLILILTIQNRKGISSSSLYRWRNWASQRQWTLWVSSSVRPQRTWAFDSKSYGLAGIALITFCTSGSHIWLCLGIIWRILKVCNVLVSSQGFWFDWSGVWFGHEDFLNRHRSILTCSLGWEPLHYKAFRVSWVCFLSCSWW